MLPIDAFIDEPLHHMSPSPGIELHPAGAEVHAAAKAAVAKHCAIKFAPLERFAFYETSRKVRERQLQYQPSHVYTVAA